MHYRFATTHDVRALAKMNHELIRDEGHRNPMTLAELERRMETFLEGEYKAVVFEEGTVRSGMRYSGLKRRRSQAHGRSLLSRGTTMS
jgi:hypothetical protein